MKALHVVGAALGLIVCAANAPAAERPSFYLDACSWNATHIVVVSEGDKIDGDVEVLESWKGDLKKGDKIAVPALAEFAPDEKRVISKGLFGRNGGRPSPPSVTCSRMVLFLIRKEEEPKEGKPAGTNWLPAGMWGQIKASTAWIEGDQVFAFAQQLGEVELISQDKDERQLKRVVDDIVTSQANLAKALRQGDAEKLETVAVAQLRSESEYVRLSVITELGNSGAKGLPTLRRVLRDNTLLKYHDRAITALAKAGGADVGQELTELLEQELEFWKKVGPELPKGWQNSGEIITWDEAEWLRNHCGRAYAAINGLGKIRHAGGRETLTEFRNYWHSLPQLSETDQLEKACDAALGALPRQ